MAQTDKDTSLADIANDVRERAGGPAGGFDTDVIIIGYGPCGVASANFLGAADMRAIALERDSGIYPRARAVTVNDWTLRYFQAVGLDQLLLQDMDQTVALRFRTYAGKDIFKMSTRPGTLGHPPSNNIYQPVMEQTLRDGAARYGNRVQVRFGQNVTAIAQDADGVTVTVTDMPTGQASTVRGRYALACDGGASTSRAQLGIKLLGSTIDTKWVVVDARVKRWWPDRQILTMWSDPRRPVVDIPLALGNHRWEFPLGPHESEDDFATTDQLWPLLKTMGVTPEDVEIHQHAFYKHHVRHAERWREGRVFLVGDAAHLMPPWAGQGMQSGVRDAFNISWKLREVLAGRLPETVLDTYESERAPNVAAITRGSEMLGRIVKMQMSGKQKWLSRVGHVLAKLGVPPPSPAIGAPSMGPGWLRGAMGARSAIGRMIPQPKIGTARGRIMRLDDVLGHGFALLGDATDPATFLTATEKAAWDRLDAHYIAVRAPDDTTQSAADIVDLDGSLRAWLRRYGAKAVAIRPDRFVAAAVDAGGAGMAPPASP